MYFTALFCLALDLTVMFLVLTVWCREMAQDLVFIGLLYLVCRVKLYQTRRRCMNIVSMAQTLLQAMELALLCFSWLAKSLSWWLADASAAGRLLTLVVQELVPSCSSLSAGTVTYLNHYIVYLIGFMNLTSFLSLSGCSSWLLRYVCWLHPSETRTTPSTGRCGTSTTLPAVKWSVKECLQLVLRSRSSLPSSLSSTTSATLVLVMITRTLLTKRDFHTPFTDSIGFSRFDGVFLY